MANKTLSLNDQGIVEQVNSSAQTKPIIIEAREEDSINIKLSKVKENLIKEHCDPLDKKILKLEEDIITQQNIIDSLSTKVDILESKVDNLNKLLEELIANGKHRTSTRQQRDSGRSENKNTKTNGDVDNKSSESNEKFQSWSKDTTKNNR